MIPRIHQLSATVVLGVLVSMASTFQLRPSQTTAAASCSSRYFVNEDSRSSHQQQQYMYQQKSRPLCLQQPVVPSSSSSSLSRHGNNPISLSVTLLPQEEDNNEKEFFFRAPFPAEIPIIPSELTDDTAFAQAQEDRATTTTSVFWEPLLDSYWGPRIILVLIAIVYATNFPLGAIMNEALPASAATSSRMVLAALALSPFVSKIKPHLRWPAVLCGCGTALGYVTQSLALVDTDPSKVSFLGAATVLWCPFLEWLIEKKPMGIKDAPQTWLAAMLCMFGVGALELYQPGATASVGFTSVSKGDLLALVQAMGFGTGCFLSARMVQKDPDQVLPITATLIATSALWSGIWALMDGWMFTPDGAAMMLPNLLFADGFHTVAMAVVWTGLISTSFNFVIEISALGRVPPSEASVLLASEPLWAALLAATVFHQSEFGFNDYLGGTCILLACLANAVLKPHHFQWLFGPAGLQLTESEEQ